MPNSVGLEVEEVDIFQFANVPFTINAFFKDINTNQIRTGETSNLKVLLAFEGNASSEFRCKEHHPNLLEVVSNTGIQDNGRATIVVKIKDVSMNHDHKRFVVYLEAYRPQGNNNIIGAITNPITTIQHKLVIAESYSAPFIWYKDEGAKDKCIKVNVRLVDSNQQVVTNRPVPLTANLVYSSGQIVQPSTVLTIFHDKESKVLSIGENGTEIIKFRVNEVSRNHRKQLFHLLVAADASQDPNFSDISPATSIPFEVKSKRSSDARKEHIAKGLTADEDSSDDIIISAPTTSVRTNTSKETQSTNISSTGNSATTVTATTSAISLSGSTKKSRTNISDTPLPAVSASSHSSSITPASSSNVNAKRLTNVPTGSSSSSVAPTVAAENPTVASGVVPPTPAVSITAMNQGVVDELSLDTPFKALFSLADWTNVAARVLSEIQAGHDGSDPHDGIQQLIDTYPVRAQSCLQYLQQFLSMQEQHLVQQHALIGALHQQQQTFFHTLESLNPVRSSGSNSRSVGSSNGTSMSFRTNSNISSVGQVNAINSVLPTSQIPSSVTSLSSDGNIRRSLSSTVPAATVAAALPSAVNRSTASQSKSNTTASSSKKRSLDCATEAAPSMVTSSANVGEFPSAEGAVTIIIAKRVALSENTDDFGIPAYTTITANGVSLLGFYKEMFDTVRDEKVWVFRPLQSYDIFNDNDINLTLIEEILDLLEHETIINDGLFFEIRRFKDSLPRMRQEAFMKLARYEQARGGLSIVFLDKLMQKGSK